MSTELEVRTYLNSKLMEYSATATSDWYAGISSDPEGRLFDDHGVDKASNSWAYMGCESGALARIVEKRFLDAGCDGGLGGGDADSRFVYVYLKTGMTAP